MDWLGFAGSIIGSIVGGLIGGLFTFLGVKMTLKHDEVKKKEEERKRAYDERPRLEIVAFKGLSNFESKSFDLDAIFLNCASDSNRQNFDSYDKIALDSSKLISVEYEFKNIGKTEIDNVCFVSNLKKNACLLPYNNAKTYVEEGIINYDILSSKRFIKPGETFKARISYIENQIVLSNLGNATIGIYFQDINGRYWHQPLFCPKNETDNSTLTDRETLKQRCDLDD